MPAVAESIGYGTTCFINDGGAGAYVQMFNVVSIDPGSSRLQTTESKRLDLTDRHIVEVPTLFKGGDITIKQQFSNAGFPRINTLKDARTLSNFKVTITDDAAGTTVIAPGYFVENKPASIEADKITEMDITFTVTGKRT